MIPQETIEQIRQSTDIVQIIGEYLRLKKRGRNFLALCPFHTEKTASFSVSSDKQIFHCFGCGKGGNVFSFLMEHEKMSFVEAVKLLAAKTNIQIKDDYKSDYNRQVADKIYYANSLAVEFYHKQLMLPKYSGVLKDYLFSKRKIKPETVEQFSIGLAGEEWEGFVNYARSKDLKGEDLQKAGLATRSEKNQKYYDRFRQRLMFPIFNLSQKPIAFGGRTLKKGEPAKYINSPENAVYKKSRVLYGLRDAREAIKSTGAAILVEGYFDVLRCMDAGIKNVVAPCGTALTAEQAQLIHRYASEAVVVFDGDPAGIRAALRSIGLLVATGLRVRALTLPNGQDPDDYLRDEGAEKFRTLYEGAPDFVTYYIESNSHRTDTIEGRTELARELFGIFRGIDDSLRRDEYVKQLAKQLNLDPWRCLHEFEGYLRGATERARRAAPATPPPQSSTKTDPEDVSFLAVLLERDDLLSGLRDSLEAHTLPDGSLGEVLEALVEGSPADALARIDSDDARALYSEAANTEERAGDRGAHLVEERIVNFRRAWLKGEALRAQHELESAEKRQDDSAVMEWMRKKQGLYEEMDRLQVNPDSLRSAPV